MLPSRIHGSMKVFQAMLPLPLSLLQDKTGTQLSWPKPQKQHKSSTYFVLFKLLIFWIISWQFKAAERTGVCLRNILRQNLAPQVRSKYPRGYLS